MSRECKCGRPHHFSIHGNCLRCFGRAPQPKHGEGRDLRRRGWTGSKIRSFTFRGESGTVTKAKKR